jgi:multidrug resistance efflux pump
MNFIKIGVSLILIVVSLWALFLPPLFPSSTRALVNASTYRVNSPVDGVVSELYRGKNDKVAEGQPVVVIRRDQAKMLEDIASYNLEIVQVQTELDAVRLSVLEQRDHGALKASNGLSRTLFDLKIANQDVSDAQRALMIAEETESEITKLFDQKIVTLANLQKAQSDRIATRKIFNDSTKEVNDLTQKLTSLENEQKAASDAQASGLSNDRYFDSEVRSLGLREVALEAEMNALKQKIELLQESLKEGEFFNVGNPNQGLIWQQALVVNQTLSRGDLMFKVAKNDDVFIEAYLSRHFLDSVATGDRAMVYLNDEKRFYAGRVVSIQSLEQDDSKNYAVPSISPNLFTLKLKISIDDNLIGTNRIGRLAKVIVTSADPSIAEKLMIWISIALRSNS